MKMVWKALEVLAPVLWGLGLGFMLARSFFGASRDAATAASACLMLFSVAIIALSYSKKSAEKQNV